MLTHTNADKYISMLIQTDTCSMLKHTHKRTHTHAHTCLFSMQTFLSSCSYLCRRAGIQHVLHSREGGGQSIQRTGEAGMLCLHVMLPVHLCMVSVCAHVCLCVHMYVFASACLDACLYFRVFVGGEGRVRAQTCTSTCTCVCACVCVSM